MASFAAWMVAGVLAGLHPTEVPPAPAFGSEFLTRQLLEGCLQPPSEAATVRLALAIGATPYSDARTKLELARRDTLVVPDTTKPGDAYRTETSVVTFRGWDLPGQGTGSLDYHEELSRQVHIEQSTGQPVTATRATHDRSCHVEALVANGRAIYELFERLQDRRYGILITDDRRRVVVFIFDEDRYDIELSLLLERPLPDVPPGNTPAGTSRLVLTDGGPRFVNGVVAGIPTVTISRETLLAGIDLPATMAFSNMVIEPVVERLGDSR